MSPNAEEQSVTDGSDLEWLGLERVGPGHWSFVLAPSLSRLDLKFYGGTGVAVATAVMEAETGRRALWTTAQFVASAPTGARMDCRVEIVAGGRRTSQVRVTGWDGERLVFSGQGATGEPRPGPLQAQFSQMPEVPPPADCPRWVPRPFVTGPDERPGWLSITDARLADERGSMWMRLEGRPLSRAGMAFVADIVPNGVLRAAGRTGAGTSLDNTVRFGPEPEGEWVLVHVEPHLVSGGYVHGGAGLWSTGGSLLGVASQTAGIVLFD